MNNRRLTKVLIWGFLFLYLLIAGVSFFHAIEFFGIGNVKWMAVTLSIGFEVGLALSLAAVLLSEDNKKNILPWILMIVLCAVQCCGNVYSTYKYIALSETEYYQYLAKPLLFWMEGVTEESVQIVVSWIIGAILPIIALFMTDMVATNIKNLNSNNEQNELQKDTEEKRENTKERIEEVETKQKSPVFEEPRREPVQESADLHDSDELVESLKGAFKPTFNEKLEEPVSPEENATMEEKPAEKADFQNPAVSEAEIPAEKQGRFRKWVKKITQSLKSEE